MTNMCTGDKASVASQSCRSQHALCYSFACYVIKGNMLPSDTFSTVLRTCCHAGGQEGEEGASREASQGEGALEHDLGGWSALCCSERVDCAAYDPQCANPV